MRALTYTAVSLLRSLHQFRSLSWSQTPRRTLMNDAISVPPSQRAFIGTSDDTPVAIYVDALFALALRRRASDIHLEPQKHGLTIRLRIDGLLQHVPSPTPDVAQRLCARIKIMAAMDIAERRLPQDGRFTTRCDGQPLDLRAVPCPHFGEKNWS